jgi:hypothetical protein
LKIKAKENESFNPRENRSVYFSQRRQYCACFQACGNNYSFFLDCLNDLVWLFYGVGSEFLCQFLLSILAVLEVISFLAFFGMFCPMVWSLLVESSPNFMWTIYGVLAGFLVFASSATHSMAEQKITQMQDDLLCQVCVETPATTSAEKTKPGK